MTELIQEIYGTIMRNKLRTLLTGFSVAWGIFMLIVLLGAGNGLIHAFENQSKGMIMNSMKIYPGMTSQPYKGMKEGRSIYLKESDRKLTATSFPDHIIQTGATVSKSDVILTYGKEALSIGINGVFPNYPSLEAIKIKEGRFVNARDMEERRKIIVLHEKTVKNLFPHTSPIGKYLNAQGVPYQVVGIYTDQNSFSPSALVPFTTLQTIYQKGDSIDNITFTTKGLADEPTNEQFEAEYRQALGLKKQFSPTDEGAIWIWNRFTVRNASVPYGISTPESPEISTTQWRTVSESKNLRYFFESSLTPNAFWVNLKDFDLSEGAPVFKLSIANGEMYHGNTAKNFKTALPFKFMGVKG